MSPPAFTLPARDQQQLLAAARGGDESAYSQLVETYHGELHAHCYRMLGSVHDAEDALQDALLRAWRALPRFEGRSSLRSWLYRIATNTCLDLVARRPKRVVPIDHGPPADARLGPGEPLLESIWVEPYPDEVIGVADGFAAPAARYEQRESVELAFIAALQHLPARQRAVLILREVLGFSAAEVARAIDTSVPAVNSALQRARKTIDEHLPQRSQQETLRALGDDELRALVEGYVDAWERGDVEAVVAMLTAEATLTMPPMPTWYRGDGIRIFLEQWAFSGRAYDAEGRRRVRVLPARANGQPAFGTYSWDPARGTHLPTVLQVLTLRDGRIEEIDGFVTPAIFDRFGLPAELAE
jgi:RNA polymerase sigma-70 factor (ECF subfamily)